MNFYHNKSIQQTLAELSSRVDGLSEGEALSRSNTRRQEPSPKRKSIVFKFLEQFFDFMIIILLVASFISIAIGIVKNQSE